LRYQEIIRDRRNFLCGTPRLFQTNKLSAQHTPLVFFVKGHLERETRNTRQCEDRQAIGRAAIEDVPAKFRWVPDHSMQIRPRATARFEFSHRSDDVTPACSGWIQARKQQRSDIFCGGAGECVRTSPWA
jgi:hypothetical protein